MPGSANLIGLPIPPVTLVLGGARSGKSAYAEGCVERHAEISGGARIYLATAESRDDEMAARIAAHRARRGERWTTVEEPLDLPGALARAAQPGAAVVVDCLTLWLANLIERERDVEKEVRGLADGIARLNAPIVLVANEVGLGIVPDNAQTRAFRDHAGRLNQRIAATADRVVFVAAGLPLLLKGGG
ncbi:MAG: bifunctional adenosylcobinamide kinase/adenosylcobinamide-phosphate guanylyltransferase [Proteobacteria bacterium]|nr:bifunctional adenosylcobinamide kinase/adenosylcobinamide-phosphate guanylyltransferase [Pseudomonadota bacterium]